MPTTEIYITREERRMVNDNRPGGQRPMSRRREWATLIGALAASLVAGLVAVYILTSVSDALTSALWP